MTDLARFARGASLAALSAALTLAAAPAFAQDGNAPATQAERSYSIAAQPLDQALAQFARAADVQLAYSAELVSGRPSPGVSGSFTVQEALARLLGGTGLSFRMTDGRTFTLMSVGGADGEQVTGVVSVEGVQGSPYFGGAGQAAGVNGVNGSRDITATEGTGSFTSGALTIGSKVPQALKDVPQSISVLTSERLEQQNVTDFTSALKQLPGVSLVQGTTSLENTFYSRGFAITSIQVDGGAPLTTGFADGVQSGFYPQIDMSIYDHVELLRGASGLFNGYGDPSGSVNLVRKKPLDHSQFSVEAQAGSWSNYRIVADATSPLALDGRLRGRLVMTYQDQHHFYDLANDNKTLIYGIAEFDATPTTTLRAGIDYTRQDSLPWNGGLPRYRTGADLKLPRSTSLAFPWNRWDFDTTEIFGGLDQKLGDEWNLKVNLTHTRQSSTQKLGFSSGAVNPNNDLGPVLRGTYNDYATKQFSAEAVLTGAFELFGQRQEITVGANRVDADAGGQVAYTTLITSSASAPYQPYPGGPRYCYTTSLSKPCPAGTIAPRTPPINLFDFDPYDPIYNEPSNPLASSLTSINERAQSGAYMNLRLTAFNRFHLTTGLRWSRYEYKYAYNNFCINTTGTCASLEVGDPYGGANAAYSDDDFSWPPPVNLSFDITKQLTAYVGYTDIYQSQSTYLTTNLQPIGPVTGSNIEAGAKWSARGGRLNLSIAAYRIKQSGFGTLDGAYDLDTGDFVASNGDRFPNYGSIDANHSCCFTSDPEHTLRSKGIDFEVSGEILPGWQVSGSYTFNETKQEGTWFEVIDGQNKPIVSLQPKQLYKVWMSYDFEAGGASGLLRGLTLSGGVNGQSSGYQEGEGCLSEFIVTNDVTGEAGCATGGSYDYNFTVPAYAVVSGRIDYRFSDNWALAVNLENVLDKTYYQTVGSVDSGNWYGSPRNVTATLRAKW
ncbi:MAG: TonB-dependent receptor [Candidatus Andeanibacterium colombiense]|uniref:TonB-dependent receptor n=1 Tax=Candidatus Andeanibacterium colombiense TaxID=3121345 RepID=A0AAJ5XCG8_9SPHN|nr:MAG: TonB-dependent receptor [Sphingomonadaceae bacterium]